MSEEVNKKTQYHYQYAGPKQIEGETPIPNAVPQEGKPKVRDTLASSEKSKEPLKPSQMNDPQLPYTEKGKRVSEVKKGVIKAEQERVITQGTAIPVVNPWLANPSARGQFLTIYFALLTILSDTRFKETMSKIDIEKKVFELGKENADLAKLLKDKEAQKELFRALGSFISAGVGLVQLGGMMKGRKEAIDEANKKWDNRINAQKTQVTQLENAANPVVAPGAATNDAAINKARMKVIKMEHQKDSDLHTMTQLQNQKAQTTGQVFRDLSEACIGIGTSVITQEMGVYEKFDKMNNALMQYFNSAKDDYNKNADNMHAQFDKTLQDMRQVEDSHRKAHYVGNSPG